MRITDNLYPCEIYVPEVNDIVQGIFQDELIFKGVINLDDIHSIDEYIINTELIDGKKLSMIHYYDREHPVVYIISLDEIMSLRKEWIRYRDINLPLFKRYN